MNYFEMSSKIVNFIQNYADTMSNAMYQLIIKKTPFQFINKSIVYKTLIFHWHSDLYENIHTH
jgi:hypothetical protein